MRHDIRPHASQPRCYKCGSTEIVQLCHHCTVAMCEEHTHREIPDILFGRFQDYKGLGLNNSHSKEYGAHCDDCLHFSFHLDWRIVGIIYGVSLICFLVSFLPFDMPEQLRNFLRLLIVIIAGIFFIPWIRNKITQSRHRPHIPLIGDIQDVAVEETIKGSIKLDQFGFYSSLMSSNSQNGKIVVNAKLNSLDRDRVNKYHRLYPSVIQMSPLTHLGYLALKGDASVRFARRLDAIRNPRPHTIPIIDYLSRNLFLLGHDTSEGVQWKSEMNYRYDLSKNGSKSNLPIQLYPRVIHHKDDQWALELMVQLAPNEKLNDLLSKKMVVEKLTFQPNGIWGEPEVVNKDAVWKPMTSSSQNSSNSVLAWKKFEIEDGEQFPRRENLYVRFEGGLDRETAVPLKGRLEVSFGHAFSGLEGVDFFYPTGFLRELPNKPRVKTTILVDFELDLRSLSFHQVYAPPIKPLELDHVIPSYEFVQAVSDELSEMNCYVQQIIENPPRTNIANAKKINRFWRIEGRQYFDLYPIDFHIVITGFEDYQLFDRPQFGCTRCELKVNALVDGDKMRMRVNHFITMVYGILEAALRDNQNPPNVPPPGEAPMTPKPQPPIPPTLPPNSQMPPPAGPVA